MMERNLKWTPEMNVNMKRMMLLGRMAKVEEVLEVVCFLCTPSASYISGTEIKVDAGFGVTRGFSQP